MIEFPWILSRAAIIWSQLGLKSKRCWNIKPGNVQPSCFRLLLNCILNSPISQRNEVQSDEYNNYKSSWYVNYTQTNPQSNTQNAQSVADGTIERNCYWNQRKKTIEIGTHAKWLLLIRLIWCSCPRYVHGCCYLYQCSGTSWTPFHHMQLFILFFTKSLTNSSWKLVNGSLQSNDCHIVAQRSIILHRDPNHHVQFTCPYNKYVMLILIPITAIYRSVSVYHIQFPCRCNIFHSI